MFSPDHNGEAAAQGSKDSNESYRGAMETFNKYNPGRTGQWEAAGIDWLAQASQDGGVPIAQVLEQTDDELCVERISEGRPSPEAAEEFGRRLFITHSAGAPAFGAGPVDAQGQQWRGNGYQGPNSHLLPLRLGQWDQWGEFYADAIIDPLVAEAAGSLASEDKNDIAQLQQRLRDGEFDNISTPARIHGDLWSGNVLWREDPKEVVLIDPMAHGGHPETDLGALALFGVPHQERIMSAYQEAAGWDGSWRDRIGLHQLHLLLMHVAVFGSSYSRSAMAAVYSALRL